MKITLKREKKMAMKNLLIEESPFESKGLRCSGRLFRPKSVKKDLPVVIMAHGFGAEQTFRIPAYAERFVRAGMAVFTFDYRNFGGSEGEPRNLVSPKRHLKDWESALSHVRGINGINNKKIAIWGSSFSGGHVIFTAARDGNIAAVVSQVPFLDGLNTGLNLGFVNIMKLINAGHRDIFRIITGRKPYTIPIVSRVGGLSVMNKPGNYEGYLAIVPEDSSWKNEMPARSVLTMVNYRPVLQAKMINCPVKLIVAKNDNLVDYKIAEKMASKIKNVEMDMLPVGHFDVYIGEMFEKVVKMETEFLIKHLLS